MPALAAIVIGHRESKQGARSVDGTTEFAWNTEHAIRLRLLLVALGVEAVIIEREDRRDGYRRLPALVNATRARCCVSLHWNGSASASATGSEALYYSGSRRGRELAEALDIADDVLGLKDRGLGGVKARAWEVAQKAEGQRHGKLVLPGPLSKRDAHMRAEEFGETHKAQRQRGAYLLECTSMPCCIVEPAFGSNPDDWRVLNQRAHLLARAQAEAIVEWLS